jgi:hypothetical protein
MGAIVAGEKRPSDDVAAKEARILVVHYSRMQPRLCLCWLHVDYKFVPVETNWHVSCGLFNYDIISVCHVDCSDVETRLRPMENDGVGKNISAVSMTWPYLNL